MRQISAAVELQQLPETAAQCKAQALIARQRAAIEAHYYRVQAERFKALAADTGLPKVQASRLRIATIYERLAELAESAAAGPEGGKVNHRCQHPADDPRPVRAIPKSKTKAFRATPEDPLVEARAHCANVKTQSEGQEAETAELSHDDRQIASAALVKLSRTLCEISVTLSHETREKLRLSRAQEHFV